MHPRKNRTASEDVCAVAPTFSPAAARLLYSLASSLSHSSFDFNYTHPAYSIRSFADCTCRAAASLSSLCSCLARSSFLFRAFFNRAISCIAPFLCIYKWAGRETRFWFVEAHVVLSRARLVYSVTFRAAGDNWWRGNLHTGGGIHCGIMGIVSDTIITTASRGLNGKWNFQTVRCSMRDGNPELRIDVW